MITRVSTIKVGLNELYSVLCLTYATMTHWIQHVGMAWETSTMPVLVSTEILFGRFFWYYAKIGSKLQASWRYLISLSHSLGKGQLKVAKLFKRVSSSPMITKSHILSNITAVLVAPFQRQLPSDNSGLWTSLQLRSGSCKLELIPILRLMGVA
jgi:hypothetical protein